MREALWTEALKARRSRLRWVTVAAFVVATGVGGLFMFILADPRRARRLGLLGAKAQLSGASADWPSYLGMLAQTVAIGGMLIFGMMIVWVFGREFSDHTAKDLLALPTSRPAVVGAKFIVVAVWAALLTVQTVVLGLTIGWLLNLPGWSASTARDGLVTLILTAVMTLGLATPLALAASVGRGYLAAVGVLFVLVFLAQIVAALGYGHVFPWSVPALYSGMAGADQPRVTVVGYLLVAFVPAASIAATVLWWRNADQPH